jgi:hypothetical protein
LPLDENSKPIKEKPVSLLLICTPMLHQHVKRPILSQSIKPERRQDLADDLLWINNNTPIYILANYNNEIAKNYNKKPFD